MSNDLSGMINQFIEDTRDEDGAQSFVWLPHRGVMVHLDTCTDLELLDEADNWLALELDRLKEELRRRRNHGKTQVPPPHEQQ